MRARFVYADALSRRELGTIEQQVKMENNPDSVPMTYRRVQPLSRQAFFLRKDWNF
jgi:hypothetical protein